MPAASTAKALDERRLYRSLRAQGFDVDVNGSAVKMTAPDGEPLSFHRSTFADEHGSDANRARRNALGVLKRHGFDPAVEPERGGVPDEVQAEREQLDAQLAADAAESEQAAREVEARRIADADRAAKIDALTEKQRELFDRVIANPGLRPGDYAPNPASTNSRGATSMLMRKLIDAGLLEITGRTSSARAWPAGEAGEAPLPATSSRPAAGPVRRRQQAPADPQIAYQRLVRQLAEHAGRVSEITGQIVEIHDAEHAELIELRAKVRRVESVLGRAIDAL